jgi:hypothetical protein
MQLKYQIFPKKKKNVTEVEMAHYGVPHALVAIFDESRFDIHQPLYVIIIID